MNQRCLAILELLNREETLDVNDLAERLGVSAVTVRKDLAMLENKGLLHRQHGCAMRVSPNDVGYRMTFDYETKRRIARKAADTACVDAEIVAPVTGGRADVDTRLVRQ